MKMARHTFAPSVSTYLGLRRNNQTIMDMRIQLNEREALLIVAALGVYQNRVGQKASWKKRKRMNTLRSRLADAITICDEEEVKELRKALQKTQRSIERRTELGIEISTLRERVKAESGITDEKVLEPEEDGEN